MPATPKKGKKPRENILSEILFQTNLFLHTLMPTRNEYESWVLANLQSIATLESSLRSLTWFLPGRFKDAELASEALAASLNLVSMYHDTLLAKVAKRNPNYRPLIPSSLHTRFTRAWSDTNNQYKWAARSLELIRFTELVLEMGLRRKVSPRARWRSVVLLEIIKAILRLILLRITRRPLLSPPIPERDFDPESVPQENDASAQSVERSSGSSSPPATPAHLKNNRVPLPPHSLLTTPPPPATESSVEEYLLPKALTTSAVKPSHTLMKTMASPRDWLAEIVYILRPLVYVSLLVSNDKKSTRPLTAALILEVLSRILRRSPPPHASLERSEYARRDRDMAWYLLRGSIWESYTKPKLESFAAVTSSRPLLGLFGALVRDWIPLIDEYYYCKCCDDSNVCCASELVSRYCSLVLRKLYFKP
ncbi:Peroxisomal membrane protein PEX16 [Mycena indigotica]|uniref:Peroxisomal membrane protein PEX16 n=1 Tax=Mycena indigotica TaxID=2126181 RepID=A0A8H6SX54_9AGAR|nr:Peroxisomal membrane protein PEX16 [Mycena indigotica]KAF7306893.1 Peroxisomal membrane protein PEX16 [Mycena indigotica]